MKHRILKFEDTEKAREAFTLLYQGFVHGGNGAGAKGMEIIRREASILDKLDAVSEEHSDGSRKLLEGEHSVLLIVPEYELLKRNFQHAPWNTKISREIRDIDDWLSTIPLEDDGGR